MTWSIQNINTNNSYILKMTLDILNFFGVYFRTILAQYAQHSTARSCLCGKFNMASRIATTFSFRRRKIKKIRNYRFIMNDTSKSHQTTSNCQRSITCFDIFSNGENY